MLQDLQPYICTFPECSDGFQMYSSRRLWLEHERLVHRRIWQCFHHVNAVFPSSAELQNHLQSEHSFTKAQIQTLLDVCESSVKDIRTKCPICLEKGPFERGLDNHLSSHLEIFATFSIPRGIFSSDESKTRADSKYETVQGNRPNISTKSFSLQAASFKGQEEEVKLLVQKGADVNTQGGTHGNALQAASYRGHEKIVTLLVQKGADVNAQGGYYGNALQAASIGGHEKIVALLVHEGADVNAQGGLDGNALQAASQGGHDKIATLLVQKGADVNAQGGFYGNALQAASCRGHEKIVKLLAEEGADVNAHGGRFGNALKAALDRDLKTVVELLIEYGAKYVSE